ncbi:probable ubiquitin carboxyl-terminal hydrolase MINDY-4 [Galendromus occidentalis]|uniref:Ubiquitin carboxyl-terminal hydrolase MINDY n=1 Tax=Galendromus occidentalis TaxID=34638 RepID=A0AAJ6QUR6_9ACAR|nr:probable ubiquitin carboxyl-terminal hydrolase MINDY-4 [Galendromus occidentalis]
MSFEGWTHLNDQQREKLFDTILGKGNSFSKVWLLQHIDFPSIHNECRLQIKQYYNGPCGAVASIQAWLVKTLLFGDVGKIPRHLSEKEKLIELRKRGLIGALSEILFSVTPYRRGPVRLIVPFPPDGTIEESVFYNSWHYATLYSVEALHDVISRHFDNICRYGMVPLLCSMIFSRGADRVHIEAAKDTLVDPAQEDCFQPLVNLILTGRAVSNVFDAPKTATEDDHPKVAKYGIIARSTIGFMTSVELTNKIFTVGSHFKTPFLPIWVIHGDFHYSLLFSDSREVISEEPTGQKFFWYTVTSSNGTLLNKQYTLTVDTADSVSSRAPKMEDSLKVVRDCVNLRWPSAELGIQGVATEKKVCQKSHAFSTSSESSMSTSK